MTPAESVRIPTRFTSGDAFTASVTPSALYTDPAWSHALTLITANTRILVPGVMTAGEVVFAQTAAPWPPARYQWSYSVSDGTARHTLTLGTLDVLADPATAHDPRTHARKVLDALEAFLERADYGASRTKIADRELQNIPLPELLMLRDRYRSEVRREEVAAGFRPVGRILTRF